MSKLDTIIRPLVITYATKDPVTPMSLDKAKDEIKALFLDLMDTVDPFHTADWYVALHKEIEKL